MLDTVIASDLHLGDKRCDLEQVASLFGHIGHVHQLIIAGDVLDSWVANTWDIDKLTALLGGLISHTIILESGNHDPNNLQELMGDKFIVKEQHEVDTRRGKYLVIHGHQYDNILQNYSLFVRMCFSIHQVMLKKFGWDLQKLLRFSLSKRNSSKYFKSLVRDSIKQMMVDFKDYAGVICGHTHFPIRQQFDDFEYINCGDLIEHYSYVKIDKEGEVSLCGYFPTIKN